MFNHPYVMEKLIELEKPPAIRFSSHELPPQPRRANGLARSLGGAMRRAGERLEAWAGPAGTSRPDCFPEVRGY